MITLSTTLFSAFPRKRKSISPRTPELTCAYIETGDERCPIAGIWSRIGTTDPAFDEPERALPVMRTLFPWRASHTLFKLIRYSTT